jgi:DnaK suppressor protein
LYWPRINQTTSYASLNESVVYRLLVTGEIPMSDLKPYLDATFVAAKRKQLMELRETLRNSAKRAEGEENSERDSAAQEAREPEEDAQKLDALEKEGLLVSRSIERLAQIDRALAKIADGSYGISDVSGERIPIERLNAMPEATNTVREQEGGVGREQNRAR